MADGRGDPKIESDEQILGIFDRRPELGEVVLTTTEVRAELLDELNLSEDDLSRQAVYERLKKLAQRGFLVKKDAGRGVVWHLPNDHRQLVPAGGNSGGGQTVEELAHQRASEAVESREISEEEYPRALQMLRGIETIRSLSPVVNSILFPLAGFLTVLAIGADLAGLPALGTHLLEWAAVTFVIIFVFWVASRKAELVYKSTDRVSPRLARKISHSNVNITADSDEVSTP